LTKAILIYLTILKQFWYRIFIYTKQVEDKSDILPVLKELLEERIRNKKNSEVINSKNLVNRKIRSVIFPK
jgi:hypothetical protein